MDIGWFNSAVPSTIQCLSATVVCPLAFKEFKISKAPYKVHTPCISHSYMAYSLKKKYLFFKKILEESTLLSLNY